MVFNSDGLFSRAHKTADEYNKAKAREILEILLSDAQIQKYAEGLTEEQLDKKIQEIGELIDKEDLNPNIQDVIVEGHIFKIDKSVPKIIDYVKPADGIIITATATTTMPEILSVEEAKVIINDDNIRSFIGVQVDYPSPKKGTWRVFYYDGTEDQTVKVGPHNLFVAPGNGDWWLASPSGRRWYEYILNTMGTRNCLSTSAMANAYGVCPVVAIDL